MNNLGRILIADDEETFLLSTAALLHERGYECDTVSDAVSAADKLRAGSYDLLISDIKMPGNADMQLIKMVPQIAPGMPVIMVTGYPSLESATQSIELPVVAYLVKPVDFEQLLAETKISVEHSRTYRMVNGRHNELHDWRLELGNIRQRISQTWGDTTLPGIDAYTTQAFRMIVGHLGDLKSLIEMLAEGSVEKQAAANVTSPRQKELLEAVFETLGVLEKVKNSVQVEELEVLRLKLKRVVKGQNS
ncbi:MAG: response regulator [candidate division KSB1 bacterium]